MKKFFAILLTVCLVASLFVMPVSASIFDSSEYLDLDASNIVSFNVSTGNAYVAEGTPVASEDFPVSNLLDGDDNTTAMVNFMGKSKYWGGSSGGHEVSDVYMAADLVIDLGAKYPIAGIEFVYPTAAQKTAVKESYSTAVNYTDLAWATVSLYEEAPASGGTAVNIHKTSKLNDGVNIPASGTYRYIRITGTWGNGGSTLVNELKVKVAATAEADQYGCRYADFGQTAVEYADETYPMSNLFDGDPNTHALLSLRNASNCNYSIRVVDLGEEKKIESLKLTAPSNYNALLDAIGIGNKNGNYCNIYGYENEPTFTQGLAPSSNSPLTQDPSGIALHEGALSTKEVAVNTDTPIRYLAFFTSMASYPGMLSELVVVEDDRVGSATFDVTAAAGTVDAVTYTTKPTTGSWTLVGEHPEYPISNIFDDDPESIGWFISRDTNGTHRGLSLTIDLGKDTELSAVDWTFPSVAEAEAVLEATGYTAVGGSADQHVNAVNDWKGAGCSVSLMSEDGNVTTKTTYGTIGTDAWRKEIKNLGAGYAYRYITIFGSQNYTMLLKNFSVKDIDGNELIGAQKEVVRFYVAPTLTSKFYDPEAFGMFIIPFDIFVGNGHSTDGGAMMEMEGTIANGQNYSADLVDIPAEAADTPIVVVPFVKLGGNYYYGDASAEFTLNGLK